MSLLVLEESLFAASDILMWQLEKLCIFIPRSTPSLNPCIGTGLAGQVMGIHPSSAGPSPSFLNLRSSSSRMRSLTTIRHLPKRFCPHLLRCEPAFLAPKPIPHILSLGEAFTNKRNVRWMKAL